jgi:hypothetical protein
MFRYTKQLFAAVAVLATVQAAQGPGFAVSLTEAGANKGKNVLMPLLFQHLQNVSVPDISFDGGSMKNILVQLPQPALDAVDIKFDGANNGGELVCSKATAHATADFHFEYLFLKVNGKADIKINKAALDVELDAGTQPGTPAPELAPMAKVQKMQITVNPEDIDIELTGGLVAKIAGVLIPLLKKEVIPSIITQVTKTATDLINDTLDDALKLYGTQEEIPFLAGVTADYAQVGGPEVTAQKVF